MLAVAANDGRVMKLERRENTEGERSCDDGRMSLWVLIVIVIINNIKINSWSVSYESLKKIRFSPKETPIDTHRGGREERVEGVLSTGCDEY